LVVVIAATKARTASAGLSQVRCSRADPGASAYVPMRTEIVLRSNLSAYSRQSASAAAFETP
jgi:hypothetical protein